MPWVRREPGSGTRSAFESAVAAGGLPRGTLAVALEMPWNEAVPAAVEAGAGAGVLPESVVAAPLRAGTVELAPFPLPARTFRVLRHKGRYRSRAAGALLGLIREAER